MAYGNQNSNQKNFPATGGKAPAPQRGAPAAPAARPAQAPASGAPGGKTVVYSTGLFKPDREGVKSLASVRVKGSVTIPDGAYINIYEQSDEDRKSDASPTYKLVITEFTKPA